MTFEVDWKLCGTETWFFNVDGLDLYSDLATEEQPTAVLSTKKCLFSAGDRPPLLTAAMKVFPPTFSVDASPYLVANFIMFSLHEMRATVVKVSRSKYTIKAVVRSGGLLCMMKIRIYRQGDGTTVECNRRSGDGLVFTNTFFEIRDTVIRAFARKP
eukprot:CAMPEP_0194481330 /NCGR_PEP_ID=MMETSP0253-20130528/3803_1 /TAXON_ID=2966 /ORGANISM="Noctiluca scintillans" /LENGTH=156 /DNA_ID=CAMNT_0039320805 /DNA_START=32 /DNA_END=502 /DNA_ORIENTATION=+